VRRRPGGPGAAAPNGTGGATTRLGWWAVAIVAGAVLPVQGAINAQLRADLDAPLPVAAVSFVLATAVLAVPLAVAVRTGRVQRPRWSGLRDVPWWGWLGGGVGAGYVTAVFLLIPEIGAAPTIALTVAGQQLAGAAVDHFGLLRLPRRPVRRTRLLGVAVLLAGVGLLQL
jgi:transporter family-2 protein